MREFGQDPKFHFAAHAESLVMRRPALSEGTSPGYEHYVPARTLGRLIEIIDRLGGKVKQTDLKDYAPTIQVNVTLKWLVSGGVVIKPSRGAYEIAPHDDDLWDLVSELWIDTGGAQHGLDLILSGAGAAAEEAPLIPVGQPVVFTIENSRTLCTLIDDSLENAEPDRMTGAHAFQSVFIHLVQAAAKVLGKRPDEVVAELNDRNPGGLS